MPTSWTILFRELPEVEKSPYPYAVDTSWRFGHQDRKTGIIYPTVWPTKRAKGRRRAA